MTLEEAKSYIGYGIGEGIWEQEAFDGWTDEQLIEFAKREGEKGDYYANLND